MSAIFSTDAVSPSEGGGATYTESTDVHDASPVALQFLHALSGRRIEDPLIPAFRAELLHRFDSTAQAELSALLRESDPELFFGGLLRLAGNEERKGRSESAALLFRALADSPGGEASDLARRRLAVLSGAGRVGDRAEHFLSHFVSDISEPAPLLAMGAAGMAFRLGRGATLARLLMSPSGIFTRGAAAQALAGGAGFGTEVLAFSGAMRAVNAAMGRGLDWSGQTLKAELAQSALFLGAIKTFGAAGRRLQRSLGSGAALQQASLFAGIYAGQALEEVAGFRGPRDRATAMLDSLAMLFSLNAAGRLSRALLGPRFTAWERELDLRAATMTLPSLTFGSGSDLAFAGASSNSRAGFSLPSGFHPKHVFMASGTPRGDGGPPLPLPRPTSSFPPRSSDFFPNRNPQGIAKYNPPPEELREILDFLLPHRSIDPEALSKAAGKLDWLMPEERVDLVRWALEAIPPEVFIERLTAMATKTGRRGASIHALRLLFTLQSGSAMTSPSLISKALAQIGPVMSPDPDQSMSARWKVAESRIAHALDAIFASEAEGGRLTLSFEMELSRLARNGFADPFFDDLLYFSLDVRSPVTRNLIAGSAVSMALGSPGWRGPVRDFMVGYYVVGRLAETGNLGQAIAASHLIQLRTQSWEGSRLPRLYQDFLKRRLKFQERIVNQYSMILKDAQPESLQDYYQVQASHGNRHLPEPWGVIWNLREQASLLNTQKGELTMSSMIRLQAAQNLMRDMVFDPLISKALHSTPELRLSRQQLLDLAEELPAKARAESREPLQALFNALSARGEWSEAYRLLDALYHLQLADPMLLRTLHASLLVNLDVAKHRALGTSDYELLASHLKRFSSFESRFF